MKNFLQLCVQSESKKASKIIFYNNRTEIKNHEHQNMI